MQAKVLSLMMGQQFMAVTLYRRNRNKQKDDGFEEMVVTDESIYVVSTSRSDDWTLCVKVQR